MTPEEQRELDYQAGLRLMKKLKKDLLHGAILGFVWGTAISLFLLVLFKT